MIVAQKPPHHLDYSPPPLVNDRLAVICIVAVLALWVLFGAVVILNN